MTRSTIAKISIAAVWLAVALSVVLMMLIPEEKILVFFIGFVALCVTCLGGVTIIKDRSGAPGPNPR